MIVRVRGCGPGEVRREANHGGGEASRCDTESWQGTCSDQCREAGRKRLGRVIGKRRGAREDGEKMAAAQSS